jgi:hypothetical protein
MRLILKIDYIIGQTLSIIIPSIYSESTYLAMRYINLAVPRINFKDREVDVKSSKIL